VTTMWQILRSKPQTVLSVDTPFVTAGFPDLPGVLLELVLVSIVTKANDARPDICSFNQLYTVIR
jgi:hypothetical protein